MREEKYENITDPLISECCRSSENAASAFFNESQTFFKSFEHKAPV